MNKYLLLAPLLILNFNIVSQESNDSSLEEVPSKLEQLIIDIESGKIIKALRIDRSLNVIYLDKEYDYDWRFISKQNRGATL